MASSNSSSDTQGPVFWERLRGLFDRDETEPRDGERRRRGVALTVCFLVACFLWFVFTLQDTHTVPLTLPTTVENGQGAQALTALPPSEVRVRVEGEGTELLRYFFRHPHLAIDASGEQVRVADLVRAQLPSDVTLQDVSPSMLTLQREPRLRRTVPVHLRGEVGTPATHDLMNPPRLQPDSIQVSGARSLVRSLDAWPTERVNIPNLKDSLHRRVPLADTLDGLVERSAGSVVLRAEARPFTEGMRSVDVRVVGGPGNSVTLDPPTVRVRYRTLVEEYKMAQQTDAFYATVPYEQIRADTTGRVKPRIQIPSTLTIRDVEVYPSALRYYTRVGGES